MTNRMKTEMQDVRHQNLHPREPLYGETKKRRHYATTSIAREGLIKLAGILEISEQEVIERLGRGSFSPEQNEKFIIFLLTHRQSIS